MQWSVAVLVLESGIMEIEDLILIAIVLAAMYWTLFFPPKWLFIK